MLLLTVWLAAITTGLMTTGPQRQAPPSCRDAEVQCSLKKTLAEDINHYTVEYIRSELKVYRDPLGGTKPELIDRLLSCRLHERQIL